MLFTTIYIPCRTTDLKQRNIVQNVIEKEMIIEMMIYVIFVIIALEEEEIY